MRTPVSWLIEHPKSTIFAMIVLTYFTVATLTLRKVDALPKSWVQFKEILNEEKRGSIDGTTYPHP